MKWKTNFYEEFEYKLSFFSVKILEYDDDKLCSIIYEEIDSNCCSFMAEQFLDNLINDELIDERIYCEIQSMGQFGSNLFLNESSKRSAYEIHNNLNWRKLLAKGDQIRTKLDAFELENEIKNIPKSTNFFKNLFRRSLT